MTNEDYEEWYNFYGYYPVIVSSQMAYKLKDVKIEEEKLLKKNYTPEELAGKTVILNPPVLQVNGEMGEYVICNIEGEGIDTSRSFQTGAQNIMVKLLAAQEQDVMPLEVKVTKHGRAFDIE